MILEYSAPAPALLEHDPQAAVVAGSIADAIAALDDALRVEHVGSTAVPGCAGKGYIDLLVTYPAGRLEDAKRALSALGFQRQTSRDPFPEERPMRVGSVEHAGRRYPVHAHVVAASDPEAAEMLWFRDRLRADAALVRAYVAEKRRILNEGVADGVDYAERKGAFVRATLSDERCPR